MWSGAIYDLVFSFKVVLINRYSDNRSLVKQGDVMNRKMKLYLLHTGQKKQILKKNYNFHFIPYS